MFLGSVFPDLGSQAIEIGHGLNKCFNTNYDRFYCAIFFRLMKIGSIAFYAIENISQTVCVNVCESAAILEFVSALATLNSDEEGGYNLANIKRAIFPALSIVSSQLLRCNKISFPLFTYSQGMVMILDLLLSSTYNENIEDSPYDDE